MSARTPSTPSQKGNTSAIASTTEPTTSNLSPGQIETLFLRTLSESNRLAKSNDLNAREVVMGKMINYCIRMLHSNGWVPRTVVRSMVHIETGVGERTIRSILRQALGERRDEERARRAAQQSGEVDTGARSDGGKVVESKTSTVEHTEENASQAGVVVESGEAEAEAEKNIKVENDKE